MLSRVLAHPVPYHSPFWETAPGVQGTRWGPFSLVGRCCRCGYRGAECVSEASCFCDAERPVRVNRPHCDGSVFVCADMHIVCPRGRISGDSDCEHD